MTLQERLMNKIKKVDSGCWEWQYNKNKMGYGRLSVDGKPQLAHRVSYEYFYATNPGELCVCHKCDNPSCINPDHLFLGSRADNSKDKVAKGRQSRMLGTKHPKAKLSEQDILDIRASTNTQPSLASKYGVRQVTISKIKLRKAWRHIR